MNLEVRPFGVRCNIRCHYCYQNPERDAGNVLKSYDIDRMIQTIESRNAPFTLFGGEPLMLPMKDLERLLAYGLAKFGRNGIQTNGTLIRDEHLDLFRKYAVRVGLSIDGPDELNDIRWAGSLERTRESTRRSFEAIKKLCTAQMPPALIITLHRGNASRERLPRLYGWFLELEELGVGSARLHLLEVENELVRARYALSPEENLEALRGLNAFEQNHLTKLRFDKFHEMRGLLSGRDDRASCVWNSCDPYTTSAVQGVEGNGQQSNCGRTNKDGVDFVKADQKGYERYLALYHTPQEYGGCQGCRFFLMCRGQCPGTAEETDWRNRTEHCHVLKELYSDFEADALAQGQTPLSLHDAREHIEQSLIEAWTKNYNTGMRVVIKRIQKAKAKRRQAQKRAQKEAIA